MSPTPQTSPAQPPQASPRRHLKELLDSRFLAKLDSLDIISRKILQGKLQGERRSKRRGQSVEFADHRPYVVGDGLRFVDWNIYGRLDQLFLKLFLEEQDLTVHILFDASASIAQGDPPKESAIKKLAAALAYIGLVNNNRVTLSSFADGLIGQLHHMRGRNYLPQMADLLLTTSSEGPSHFEKSCRQLVDGRIGSGVMIVLSDFFFKEGFETGLRRLISKKYDLHVIQVLSPQEISPEFTGDLKLVDIEDADVAEVTVSAALLKYYKQNMSAYCNQLKEFCTHRDATYTLMNSSQSVHTLVLNYLRRKGLLK